MHANGEVYEGEFGFPMCRGTVITSDLRVIEQDYPATSSVAYYIVKYPKGDVYEGAMANGYKQGWGLFTRSEWTYDGDWKNDTFHGKGTIKRWKEPFKGLVYTGSFIEGMCWGQGKMVWPGQWEYEGEWRENRRDGKGECHFADGEVHIGYWGRGLFRRGLVIHPNGVREEGEFC